MKTAILFLALACPAFAGQPVQLPGDRLKEALDFFNAHQKDMAAALKWFNANKDEISQLVVNVNRILVILDAKQQAPPQGLIDDAGAAIRQVSRAARAAETFMYYGIGLGTAAFLIHLWGLCRKKI